MHCSANMLAGADATEQTLSGFLNDGRERGKGSGAAGDWHMLSKTRRCQMRGRQPRALCKHPPIY